MVHPSQLAEINFEEMTFSACARQFKEKIPPKGDSVIGSFGREFKDLMVELMVESMVKLMIELIVKSCSAPASDQVNNRLSEIDFKESSNNKSLLVLHHYSPG